MDIPIYDIEGNKIDALTLYDSVQYIDGRVSKGNRHYYKGVGCLYDHHHLSYVKNPNDFTDIEQSEVFYMGSRVKRKTFIGKKGIFLEKYQPQFSDFIGTCGTKELSIIENSEAFGKSSVKIIKAVKHDVTNNQYYFMVDYSCNRIKYLQNSNPAKLRELLDYMITNDWNFIWDKNAISDISSNGLVSDVGDLFVSSTLSNKIGTVYAVLHSLGRSNPIKLTELLKLYGLTHDTSMSYLLNTLPILKANKINTTEIIGDDPINLYMKLVLKYLLVGRNCGHCCYPELGEKIKDEYITRANIQMKS